MWQQLITDLKTVMTYQAIADEVGMRKSSIWELHHGETLEPKAGTYLRLVSLHKRKTPAIKRARGKV